MNEPYLYRGLPVVPPVQSQQPSDFHTFFQNLRATDSGMFMVSPYQTFHMIYGATRHAADVPFDVHLRVGGLGARLT